MQIVENKFFFCLQKCNKNVNINFFDGGEASD